MSILFSLIGLKLRNQLKSFARSPGKIILSAIMIGAFALVVWSGGMQRAGISALRDRAELFTIIAGLYIVMFLMLAYTGLARGATFFTMPDVNLLFPAPVEPFKVLIYGLTQQLVISLTIGFFLLYQYSWMHGMYNVAIPELLIILLGYALTVFTSQVAAMVMFAAASVSDARRKAVRFGSICVAALFFVQPVYYLARSAIAGDSIMIALPLAFSGMSLRLFPFAGWLASFVRELLEGHASAWLWLLLVTVGTAALVLILRVMRQDYYEDVLQGTERAFQAKQRAKEGNPMMMNEGGANASRVRGEISGIGARVFFSKHRLEDRRASRFLMNLSAWIEVLVTVAFGVFMRFDGGWIGALSFGVYMQLLLSTNARWVRELNAPYVYLVPDPPFQKLIWCLMQSFLRTAAQSVLIWIPLGFVLKLSIPLTILLILLRCVLGVLFISGNLLVTQLWSNVVPKWLEMTLFFLIEFALLLPGLAAAIVFHVMGWYVASPDISSAALLVAVEAPLALGVLYACRNVLARAQYDK